MQVLIVAIGLAGTFILLLTLGMLITGWALWLLWGWFAVPIFGLPPLTIAQSYGVAGVVGFLTKQVVHEPGTSANKKILINLTFPFISVAFGWLVYKLTQAGY